MYGSETDNIPDHWPENAKTLFRDIERARRKLFPLMNQGADYDAHLRENQELSSRLMADIMKDADTDATFPVKKPKP